MIVILWRNSIVVLLLFVTAGCGWGVEEDAPRQVPTPDEQTAEEVAATVIEPDKVQASCAIDRCTVVWPGPGQNIPYFKVYRQAASSPWVQIGRVEVGNIALGEFRFEDLTVVAGAAYVYGVSAVNHYQRESVIVPADPVSLH